MKKLLKHFDDLGFTNRLCLIIISVLIVTLIAGYKLAVMSIQYGYSGQLLCFTVVLTPIDTALAIVLQKAVDKSKAENISNGEGVKFAKAKASNFGVATSQSESKPAVDTKIQQTTCQTTDNIVESPPI